MFVVRKQRVQHIGRAMRRNRFLLDQHRAANQGPTGSMTNKCVCVLLVCGAGKNVQRAGGKWEWQPDRCRAHTKHVPACEYFCNTKQRERRGMRERERDARKTANGVCVCGAPPFHFAVVQCEQSGKQITLNLENTRENVFLALLLLMRGSLKRTLSYTVVAYPHRASPICRIF